MTWLWISGFLVLDLWFSTPCTETTAAADALTVLRTPRGEWKYLRFLCGLACAVWHHCNLFFNCVLSGEAWINIRQGLFSDKVVKIRVTEKCWNNGVLYGDFGDLFFVATKIEKAVHGDHSLAWTRPAEWQNDG